jgi:hypothetical protein
MNAADIAHVLEDARRERRGSRCRCPLHGGRSLTLRDGNGGCVLVTCWDGCNRLDVLAELRRRGSLNRRITDFQGPLLDPRPAAVPFPFACPQARGEVGNIEASRSTGP